MNCHRLSNLLSAYIDGELTGVEMIEIRRHLDDCPECQAELDCLRATKRLVGRLKTAQPSADFADRICTSLGDVRPYSWLAAWSRLWQVPLQRVSPAVACVGLVFLGMVAFTAGGINQGQDVSQIAESLSSPVLASASTVSLEMERPSPRVSPMLGASLNATEYRPTISFASYSSPR